MSKKGRVLIKILSSNLGKIYFLKLLNLNKILNIEKLLSNKKNNNNI